MAAILEDGKLRLSGYVGDYYFDDHFTSSDVVLALAQIDDESDLTVHINSPGGVASEGAAIHALFQARSGSTDVVVEGIAMSAASLIAMAGAMVTMSAGSVLMIHDPASFTWGNSAEHSKSIEMLEALSTSYARVYADKSGKSVDECREIMKAESWFTPTQAVEAGFADETTERKAEPVAAFDYRVLAHAPKRLVALAKKKDWRLPDVDKRTSASAAARHQEENSMPTDKERADALAAKVAELEAEMKSGKDADSAAAMTKELEELRAEKAERANADAIMALEEAKGREAQAEALGAAGVDAEKAKAILAAAPKAEDESGDLSAAEYGRARMGAGGITQPGGGSRLKKGDKAVLAAAVARTNKRR